MKVMQISQTEFKKLNQTIWDFINADTWLDTRQVIQQNPDLLSEPALAIFANLVNTQGNGEAREMLEKHYTLLQRCQQIGILAAFAERRELPIQFIEDIDLADEAEASYFRTGDPNTLDEAVNAWLRILEHPSFVSDSTPVAFQIGVLNNASLEFSYRYSTQGRPDDLIKALKLIERAIQLPASDSIALPAVLGTYGNLLGERYLQTGVLPDLEQAITVTQQAVNLSSINSPNYHKYLTNLSTLLRDKYGRIGQFSNLEQAITTAQDALTLVLHNHPDRPKCLMHLANGLRDRYIYAGIVADLEQAITLTQEALNLIPSHSPERSGCLNNLASHLSALYIRTGELTYLKQAIALGREAIELTPANSFDLSRRLNNLGSYLSTHYVRTGFLADLEGAIAVTQKAIELTPSNAPECPMYLNNLGNRLSDRYTLTRNPADLERAINVAQEAVDLTSTASPHHPSFLNNLGSRLASYYALTKEFSYLEQAIAAGRQAVAQASQDSPERASFLSNLAAQLNNRYIHTGELAHLQEAIDLSQEAINLTPDNSSDYPGLLNNLASHLRTFHERTGQLIYLEQTQIIYQQACEVSKNVSQTMTLITAFNWGNWALVRKAWGESTEAYSYGVNAINYIYRVQLQRTDKEIWLQAAENLHARAAYAWAQTAQLYQGVAALEHSRAFLLSEALERIRTDLESLPDLGYLDLYQVYKNALNQIWVLENQHQVDIDCLRAVRTELDTAIEKIRQVAGYSDFLRLQPNFEEDILATMTSSQMVLVYTAVTPVGGMALIVQPTGRVTEVWLDALTDKALREKIQGPDDDSELGGYRAAYENRRQDLDSWRQAIDDITGWLWQVLMEPLINQLKSLPETANIGQVILIPQGLLGLLPLHAAWTEDAVASSGRRYALDEFLFTYSPNARALKASRERAITSSDAIFAVDNPDQSLTFVELEVTTALSYFPEGQRERLSQDNINFTAVQRCLAEYPVAHFATHGQASPTPLESYLSLGPDTAISLRAILNLRLKKARLAVLSACETAIPGRDLPDEVISLPTGLVQAGFAGVVGSLWAVDDFSTMMLMVRFYELWRDKGLAPAEALRQAQIWLRDSSRREKRAYFQWMASKDTGPANKTEVILEAIRSRNYTHPYYWAAFSYTGV